MRAGAAPKFNTVLRVLRSLGFHFQVHPVADGSNGQDGRGETKQKGL